MSPPPDCAASSADLLLDTLEQALALRAAAAEGPAPREHWLALASEYVSLRLPELPYRSSGPRAAGWAAGGSGSLDGGGGNRSGSNGRRAFIGEASNSCENLLSPPERVGPCSGVHVGSGVEALMADAAGLAVALGAVAAVPVHRDTPLCGSGPAGTAAAAMAEGGPYGGVRYQHLLERGAAHLSRASATFEGHPNSDNGGGGGCCEALSVMVPFELRTTNLVGDFGLPREVSKRGSVRAVFEVAPSGIGCGGGSVGNVSSEGAGPGEKAASPGLKGGPGDLDIDGGGGGGGGGGSGGSGGGGGGGRPPPMVRLLELELEHDTVAFWRQLQSLRGGGALAVLPTDLDAALRPSDEARAVFLATPPHVLVRFPPPPPPPPLLLSSHPSTLFSSSSFLISSPLSFLRIQ